MRKIGKHIRGHFVAYLALFFALGGTSIAASNALGPNTVGTKQLKKNAVTSSKVKNNSLTGADVLESSLAKVPKAASADNATHASSSDSATNATTATNATNANHATAADNASALGGVNASGYVTKTGVLTIPGNSFHPTGTGTNANCFPETTGGSAGAILWAPVELPNGVTVTKLTYYWWDNDGATDSTATLTRTKLPATPANGGPVAMATASSSASDSLHESTATSTITNPVIDNANYMYYAKSVIPGGQCTDAVQISYSG